jgi:hypothetical protein
LRRRFPGDFLWHLEINLYGLAPLKNSVSDEEDAVIGEIDGFSMLFRSF